MNSALQYIENHFRDASLQELATDFHQSVSQLSKLIKKTTGFTFKQLLQAEAVPPGGGAAGGYRASGGGYFFRGGV